MKVIPPLIAGRKKPYTVKKLSEIKGKDRTISVKFSCGNAMLPEEVSVSNDLIIIWKKNGCITRGDMNNVKKQTINSLITKNNWSPAYAMDIGREIIPLYVGDAAFIALAMTVKKDNKHNKLYEEFIHKMIWENKVVAHSFLKKKINIDQTSDTQVDVDTIEAIFNLL